MTRVPRGEGRGRLLAAAVHLFRQQGFAATSVDDLCTAAGVTKGAFFHHFATKDALGAAVVAHWSDTTGAMFAAADYHRHPDPLDRVFAYLDLRRALVAGAITDFSCVAGTLVQEVHATHPDIRAAAGVTIAGGAAHVLPDLRLALARHPVPGVTAEGLADFMQVTIQGGIVLAKAKDAPQAARDALDHAERYLRLLFGHGEPPGK